MSIVQPRRLYVFNEASGTAVTDYGTDAANLTISAGSSPTNYEWQQQTPAPGYLDVKTTNGTVPYMTNAATLGIALANINCAVVLKVDAYDGPVSGSGIVDQTSAWARVRVVAPSGGGDFDLSISSMTGGGFGILNMSTGLTGLTFGVEYALAFSVTASGGTLALAYVLDAGSPQTPTPVSDAADTHNGAAVYSNCYISSGFTTYGGLNGQIYMVALDYGASVVPWTTTELAQINADPSILPGFPPGIVPFRALMSNSGRRLATNSGRVLLA